MTPKSYLELISLYLGMLDDKRSDMMSARDRLLNGLQKLDETNELVANMKIELTALQPELRESRRHGDFAHPGAKDKDRRSRRKKAKVAEDEAAVEEAGRRDQGHRGLAQADLDEAMPALDSARERAERALEQGDIVEIKNFKSRPPLVQMVMEGVCILLGEKPDWDSAKKVLSTRSSCPCCSTTTRTTSSPKIVKAIIKYWTTRSSRPRRSPSSPKRPSRSACGRAP